MTKLSNKQWRKWVKELRGHNWSNRSAVRRLPQAHWSINERAGMKERFEAVAENGKVVIIREGMDCDCTQYKSIRIIDVPISIMEWWRDEWDHREGLEGPESCSFGRPSYYPEGNSYKSRDRALEAFEDGHPHYVTMGEL